MLTKQVSNVSVLYNFFYHVKDLLGILFGISGLVLCVDIRRCSAWVSDTGLDNEI